MDDEPQRPNPDVILEGIHAEETGGRRGRLKIFLGAAPGVGKTYAMLEAAQRAQAEGIDVVAGIVETHGRAETSALLASLSALPLRSVDYRGRRIEEFDLDAALARKPRLLLVDELAHSNAPGSRHPKRFHDVLELIDAGIDVWTTLNIQHVETLNDVVAQITRVRVRETVPDAVLERADEVELVDLPPDALIERLREGKVYAPDQASHAEQNFFRKGNLLALRELVLRKTAERVDAEVQAYRRAHRIADTWPVNEHVLVCVGPSPLSATLVRAACRIATSLRAKFTAVHVEPPATRPLTEDARARVLANLHLAERLGAHIVTLTGEPVAKEVLHYARSCNVTRIVIGKPTHPRWRDFVFGSLFEDIVRGSGDIDLHVITGLGDVDRPRAAPATRPPLSAPNYLKSLLVIAAATLVASALFRQVDLANSVMIYLLAVVIVATRFGRGPSIMAAVLSVALFDFGFVPPYFTFVVADVRYLITFAVMLVVGLVISGLTARVQRQAVEARQREERTFGLYQLTRSLAGAQDTHAIVRDALRLTSTFFESGAAIFLSGEDGELTLVHAEPPFWDVEERERAVATWCFSHRAPAGAGTDTLAGAKAIYLPLSAPSSVLGVMAIKPRDAKWLDHPAQRQLLDTFVRQTAIALARSQAVEFAVTASQRYEREELRNALLSSVSHDLRTPLAAITGAGSALLGNAALSEVTRRDLLETVVEEADRMNRLVGNLLDMTRLESGGVHATKEWVPLEEVVGATLSRMGAALRDRPLSLRLASDLPLVPVDDVLMQQALFNLLDNAAKYTPSGTPIEIEAQRTARGVTLEVRDRGSGLPPGSEEEIFRKFVRAAPPGSAIGTGLGLTIARGIVAAHGGTLSAERRQDGGTSFRIFLPIDGVPPPVPAET